MKTVALIYGGESGEHDVSCVSAGYLEQTIAAAGFTAVAVYISRKGEWHRQPRVATLASENVQNPSSLLQKNGRVVLTSATEETAIDFAFPIVHGTAGEDGSLQGFFEVLGLAYAGSGVATSAVCMDKALMRALFAVNQIPQVEYFVIADAESADSEKIHARIESSFGYPVFIKPCNMGSSVGVHKVSGRDALAKAIEDAARFDDHLLCEQGLPVRELEIAIAGNFPDYLISGVGEIKVNHDFYSYEAKYLDPNGADLFLEAPIEPALREEIQRLAKAAYAAVRGEGFARVDFFLHKETGALYLNEINTLPGFTPISMFPQLFRAAGVDGPEITRKIIEWGKARCDRLKRLRAASRA
jgi:D-alanine-D-alanine ligase